MNRVIGVLGLVVLALALQAANAPNVTPPATQAASRPAGEAALQADNERLRQEVVELQKTVERLRLENERLKKQWNDAVRNGTGATGGATTLPATTKPAAAAQDGPGLYKVSAGPGLKYTATVRTKSREDAINIALKTVAQKAMDFDENVNINELKVERVGP